MKRAFIAFLAFLSVCLAVEPTEKSSQAPPPEIRKEHKEYRDKDGQLTATIEKTFRGKDCILRTVVHKTKDGRFAVGGCQRIYSVGGKLVLFENDFDGDGIIDEITVCRESADCEIFRRHPDGSIEPVSSEELAQQKFEGAIAGAIFEGAMSRVLTNLQTHTVDEVMDDLKKQAEELDKALKDKK